jgi:hypothetical protein
MEENACSSVHCTLYNFFNDIGCQLTEGQQMLNKDKTPTRNAEENRARWKEHWMELFNQPGEVGQNIQELLPDQHPINNDILDTPFTLDEMLQGLRKMSNDKAAGPDGYAIEVGKHLQCKEYQLTLLSMFNKALLTGQMPSAWRNVLIVAVYKHKGPINECDNHRGISLISHSSKLLERMILNHLAPGLEEYIPRNQFGFKKN